MNLLAPSELYPLARRTEVDIRIAKMLRFCGSRLDVGVDLYNLFNTNTTTTYLQTYPVYEQRRDVARPDGHPRAAPRAIQRDDDFLATKVTKVTKTTRNRLMFPTHRGTEALRKIQGSLCLGASVCLDGHVFRRERHDVKGGV